MKKKMILTTVLMLVVMTLLATGVQANYQSKPTGTRTKASADTWITGIRQMEAENQVMGLNEKIKTSTGIATTDANNIDVHMAKNTEYGTALLLGASDYGKQGSSIDARRMNSGAVTTSGTDVKATTTGNVYGVYEMGYENSNKSMAVHEWVAGGGTSFLSGIASRYVNRYTKYNESTADPKPGDATIETKKWHGTNNATWFYDAYYGLTRGYNGAFSYNSGTTTTATTLNAYGRAAVVSGVGF